MLAERVSKEEGHPGQQRMGVPPGEVAAPDLCSWVSALMCSLPTGPGRGRHSAVGRGRSVKSQFNRASTRLAYSV